MKRINIFCMCMFVLVNSDAILAQQKFSGEEADKICKGATVITIGKLAKVPTFIQMGETSNYQVSDFPAITHTLLHMGEFDELKEAKKGKDYLGFVHHHYNQYYKDIQVEGVEYVMHEKNNRIITLDGFFMDSLQVPTDPKITADQARDVALKAYGDKKLKDSVSSSNLKAELCIAALNLDLKTRTMHLCYRVEIQAQNPAENEWIYVEALTGQITARKIVGAGSKQK
jgi:Zn-dependent metalloprotease